MEFALLALVLVPILLMTYELGRLMLWDIALRSAARAGAQYGVRSAPINWSRSSLVDQVKAAAVFDSEGLLTADKVDVAISCACPSDTNPTPEKCTADLGGDANQFYCDNEGPPRVYLSVAANATLASDILPNAVTGLIPLQRNVTFRLQ